MNTIGNIIFIIAISWLMIKLLRNFEKGVMLYIILALVSPHFKITGNEISFEIVGFFGVFFIAFINKPYIFVQYRNMKYRQRLLLFCILIIISSSIGFFKYGSTISWISIFAYFRIVCIIYILQYIYNDKSEKIIDYIITPVLYINFLVSVIQLTMPTSVKIFYDLYYKSSMTPLKGVLRLGYFDRACGTFGTPVLLGVFSLLSFAFYIGYYIEKKECKNIYFKIAFAIICGLCALSKTAIIGIPSILLICYICVFNNFKKVKNKKIILLPFIFIPIAIYIVNILENSGFAIMWYMDFLKHPFEALSTRYDTNNGILKEVYSVIKGNLLMGVGPTPIDGVFIGDSMYIVTLYSTGIIGTVYYFTLLVQSGIKNLIKRNITAFLCLSAICLAGVGASINFEIVSVVFIAYLFQKLEWANKIRGDKRCL